MKKYWIVIKNTWDETFTYRLNFTMWRVRVVLQLLTMYFFWLSITNQSAHIFGYTQNLMITYILGTSLIGSIVLSSRTSDVGDNINRGDLSIFLIRPINYFLYWFSRDIGDKAMNILFSVSELTILFLILNPPWFLQQNINFILLSLIACLLALFLYFLINLLLGFIGFWSPEVWGPRFIFYIIVTFFAGGLFPLDILPKPIFNFFQYLPFTYLMYFPLKIYLGQLGYPEILRGLSVCFIWIILMYFIVQTVWLKGLKSYTAQGR